MSAVESKAENICSWRVFRLLTQLRHWPADASNGCSQPKKPAPKWAAPTPSRPKSHNHCVKVLVARPSKPRSAANSQAFLHPVSAPCRCDLIRGVSLAPRSRRIKIEAAGRKARGVPGCTDTAARPGPTGTGFVAEVQPSAAKRPRPSGGCWLDRKDSHRQNRRQHQKANSQKPHGLLHRSLRLRSIHNFTASSIRQQQSCSLPDSSSMRLQLLSCAARRMSPIGTKRTSSDVRSSVSGVNRTSRG
jgi:hypothetical protein